MFKKFISFVAPYVVIVLFIWTLTMLFFAAVDKHPLNTPDPVPTPCAAVQYYDAADGSYVLEEDGIVIFRSRYRIGVYCEH